MSLALTDIVVVWNGWNEILTFDPVQKQACRNLHSSSCHYQNKDWVNLCVNWLKYGGISVIYFAENMTPGVKKLQFCQIRNVKLI